MIRGYTDHPANERALLAWIQAGVAATAFGFLVERFKLFLPTPASASMANSGVHLPLEGFLSAVGRYDGFALAVLGMAVSIIAAVRFVRIRGHLDDTEVHRSVSAQLGVAFSASLALIVAIVAIYLAVT
jgi:putative membrane protein